MEGISRGNRTERDELLPEIPPQYVLNQCHSGVVE